MNFINLFARLESINFIYLNPVRTKPITLKNFTKIAKLLSLLNIVNVTVIEHVLYYIYIVQYIDYNIDIMLLLDGVYWELFRRLIFSN